MTDPKYGEPVEEPTSVDDVVGRAHEGLAEAEAAGRDATAEGYPTDPASAPSASSAASVAEPTEAPTTRDPLSPDYEPSDDDYAAAGYDPAEPVVPVRDMTDAQPASSSGYAAATSPVYDVSEGASTERVATYDAPAATSGSAATDAYEPPAAVPYDSPVLTRSEPTGGSAAPSAPQPIFVQAPEAPRLRGNRGAAGAIGLVAAVAFAVLYLAAWLGFGAIEGEVTSENLVDVTLATLATWAFWVPVVVFFLAFWLLGAVINRGRWGHWVIFGLLVGVASYGGHLLGQLFQAPFWLLSPSQAGQLVDEQLLVPLAATAFILGRELTIWFGAWVAARGRRVTELNAEAQREYERTLEAGPQLYRP
ncbi:ABC transporter [Microbacterium sp. zg.Y625]|uniref:ABC transporter n=1 Tax=Microbacterium jiangjiandongii TaxID=3049071 RepID=UPI00214C5DE6|nr:MULTISPECIES: ABC transporter [unclassified Microbacterium]MCR2793981.1 ABC transporter [Microbacterium sp. zg.Y625]WIM25808.1 ABC transporter [Microbacterium sp. zg-Y625]